jgi:putative ABC transport system permease protein
MPNALTDRGKEGFMGVGRLKPGITLSQAQANVRAIGAALAKAYPVNEGHAATALPVLDFTLHTGGSSRAPMLFGSFALLAVVGIVLLIACSNVANLLLARSAARRQEMAVRLAMGASRSRLIRQLLTESVLLGLLSGAAGMLLANQGLQFLFSRLPQSANFPTPKTDATVFIFALGISLATGFIFGTIPAFKASRANPAEWLKESARTAGRSRSRITASNALLVGQVAFSFLLIVMATLFLRSISRAYKIDPGFQTDHLAVFTTNPGQAGYTPARSIEFYRDVRERVEHIPGVESASWSSNMPLWGGSVAGFGIEGRQQRSRTDEVRAVLTTVDVDFFKTFGVAMLSGRPFNKVDQENSLPVAIVNEKMAADYWPDGAIGKRIQLPGEKMARQVVGIAHTANYTGWGEPPQSCVYVPLRQKFVDAMILYVRSKGDPAGLLMPVQRELRAAAPQVMVMSSRTGAEVVWGGLFMPRMGVGLLTAFGFLALGLASIGLYGVLAYSVAQRKREIGLRMALGATRSSVLRLVLGQGMSLVAVGVVLGLAGALAAGRLLSSMLFGLGATDPLSFAGAALVLCVVSLAACYLPARAATRVDPLGALREV